MPSEFVRDPWDRSHERTQQVESDAWERAQRLLMEQERFGDPPKVRGPLSVKVTVACPFPECEQTVTAYVRGDHLSSYIAECECQYHAMISRAKYADEVLRRALEKLQEAA